MNSVYPGWPFYGDGEISAVEKVLRSGKVNYWTGADCRDFEERFASWAQCRHAISLANGTIALELALRCLGVAQGDEVIVTPLSFMASASCVVTAGATPVFADVDPQTGNLSAGTIKRAVTGKTRAVIAVHLGGIPCDMDPIMELAAQHGFYVIEDCAQAHGARYNGRSVGSIGHVSAWSFCQDKIITTGGEGGMITTSDAALHDKIWRAKDHGKNVLLRAQREFSLSFSETYQSVGTNGRMSGIQAAIGLAQLALIDGWNQKRVTNSVQLRDAVKGLSSLACIPWRKGIEPAAYRETLHVKPDMLAKGWSRDAIVSELRSRGVPCSSGAAAELHRAPAFLPHLKQVPHTPAAAALAARSIAFCVHPTLETGHMAEIISSLRSVMGMAAAHAAPAPTMA